MELHTIIGAGQVGTKLADVLLSQGHRVRLVRRGAPGQEQARLSWYRGDVTDRAFADEACRGSAVVYNCVNPPYHKWAELLTPLYTAVREAAARAGARLVVLDNLYMYGVPEQGRPLTEDSPMNPCSDKGALRAELSRARFEAHERGDLEVTCGRASDFFGPATPNASVFLPRFFERLVRGKAVELAGDPDMPHAYSYTPDVAAGLAVLGTRPEALGRVWHLPVTHSGTTRELIDRFAAAAGVTAKIRRVPRWLVKTIGLVAPQIGAAAEMMYQFEVPYLLDDSAFRAAFGGRATPVEQAVAETLAHYGKAAAPAMASIR